MKETLQNWQGTAVVMGVDWGDSGKGRLIDDLSGRADIVARFNGGSNTGHTIENEKGKFALHIMPSGIFNPEAVNLVGRNVALDLESLVAEMDVLDAARVSYENLVIDKEASLTMTWHKMRDGLREKLRGDKKVGTTGKGVGPTYADRVERVGLLARDLLDPQFEEKLKSEVEIQNQLYDLDLDHVQIAKAYKKIIDRVKKYIGNTTQIVQGAQKDSKNILFEGAQGYFLDIDAGTYPFVTSSNPGVSGVSRSFDITRDNINHVIGITKAYTTRVGEGPMPTKIEGKDADYIIKKGREVGTTTGRVRSPGWLDLVLIREAATANGLTSLAITKVDVLSGLKKISLCVEYTLDGKDTVYIPHDAEHLSRVKPVFKIFDGWDEEISDVRSFNSLPKNAQIYLLAIEEITGVPIHFISVGPYRGQVIYK